MRRIVLACGVATATFLIGTFAYLLWLDRHLPEASLPRPKPAGMTLPAAPAEVPYDLRGGHLSEPHLFGRGHLEALAAVTGEVVRGGGMPDEYYAQVEPPDEDIVSTLKLRERRSYLVFHLWHVSAFSPENRGVDGNPGGRCMSMLYDKRQKKVVEKWGWK